MNTPRESRPARVTRPQVLRVAYGARILSLTPVDTPSISWDDTEARKDTLCQTKEGQFFFVTVRQRLFVDRSLRITALPVARRYAIRTLQSHEKVQPN